MDVTDHALSTRDARAALKETLRAAFRVQSAADLRQLMAAFDVVVVAEVAAARQDWNTEAARARKHQAHLDQTRERSAEFRRQARVIRGQEPELVPELVAVPAVPSVAPVRKRAKPVKSVPSVRKCTKCGKPEGEVRFYPDKTRPRPQCVPCELAAGKARRDRLAAAKAQAGDLATRGRHLTAVG